MTRPAPSIVVFDFGGVLLDWNPRYVYRQLFHGDKAAMEAFLAEVCTPAWHDKHDEGVGFAENAAPLIARHQDKAALIEAWGQRFDEMFAGVFQDTVDILAALRAQRTPLYALSNFPAEPFLRAEKRYDFLGWFDGRVISGQEKVIKPNPRIYQILMDRYAIDPQKAVFIDDNPNNIAAAERLGFTGIRFTSPEALRQELQALNLL
jgi:2-haloacid dehalogenase